MLSFGLRLVRALLPVAALWVPKLILDAVVAMLSHRRGNLGHIWTLVLLELAIAVSGDILGRLNTLSESLLGDRFTNLVSVRLIRHATTLDLAAFEDPVFYDKLERARQVAGRRPLLAAALEIGQDAVTLFSFSTSLILFSPWLIVLLFAAVIPAFIGETHFTTANYALFRLRTPQRRELDYVRTLGASAESAKEVKIFGLGEYLAERYDRIFRTMYQETRELGVKQAFVGSGLSLISTGGYYLAYVAVLARAAAGGISIGTLTFLAGAFSRSRAAMEHILSTFTEISQHAIVLRDLFDVLAMEPAIHSKPGALMAPRPIRDGYEFRNVAFAYPNSRRLTVQKINFRLHCGETLALIGQNGAGKTTLVKLLARLYDPTAGQILLDGVDLREYDVEGLRRQVGIIFQDYIRFDMSARENIALGDIAASTDHSRIQRAAEKGTAWPIIDRLPNGYDQMLGLRFEGGVNLSGGEWQKFALARAYMRDAQLLILDEPSAALDARAEYEIFQRLVDLAHNRMAVLISHRFSTVRMADRILMLEGGEIREEGSHQQLVTLGGHYAELFELQAAGYR
jgi:ATP-binding cassette subfamily B protein